MTTLEEAIYAAAFVASYRAHQQQAPWQGPQRSTLGEWEARAAEMSTEFATSVVTLHREAVARRSE